MPSTVKAVPCVKESAAVTVIAETPEGSWREYVVVVGEKAGERVPWEVERV